MLYPSNEGEQLFYYNCFDNLETKAPFSNILRDFVIICRCNEESDYPLFPGKHGARAFVIVYIKQPILRFLEEISLKASASFCPYLFFLYLYYHAKFIIPDIFQESE